MEKWHTPGLPVHLSKVDLHLRTNETDKNITGGEEMKLLTKELQKRLPPLYGTETIPLEEKIVQVKYFTPWTNWTWYGVEFDPKERRFWGLVDGHEKEWGYFMLDDLEKGHGPRLTGLNVERDLYFKPCKVKDLKE